MTELAKLIPTAITHSGTTDKLKGSETTPTPPTVQSVWPKFRKSILGKFFRNPTARGMKATIMAGMGSSPGTADGTESRGAKNWEEPQDEESWAMEGDPGSHEANEDSAVESTEWLVEVCGTWHSNHILSLHLPSGLSHVNCMHVTHCCSVRKVGIGVVHAQVFTTLAVLPQPSIRCSYSSHRCFLYPAPLPLLELCLPED